mmetsp:Transcript_11356/g.21258  ORF Transcript_11356/g.21258 Transcript_11356/m.21258 type:complete len:103 (+) Transcript_11356:266-574(+)
MLLLEKHVSKSDESDLLYKPLRHLLGDGKSTALLDEIFQELPETFKDLNDEQQKLAHPLMLKTAVEVAGPPGTGKTKTIVDLVCSLLLTTDHHCVVREKWCN